MATILTAKQKEVIRNIIYAVETGGQVYGKHDYSSLIAAGTNTANEVAITIGAGQWYATEAKQLLDLIRSTDKATFTKLDTEGIGSDLDTKNWSKYSIAKTSAKAKCIVKIISSSVGIKCQDSLMESQITSYAEAIQKTYGAMSADAIAECINIKHQGGDGALKRILAKTVKPYTAKTIYDALNTDPADKSNNNQVGDYVSRQQKVYEMIKTHLIGSTTTNNGGGSSMTEAQLRQSIVDFIAKYKGIAEGSAAHKQILAYFNDSKLCSRYKMTTNDAWCATTVSAAFIANGLAGAAGSNALFRCVECSCGMMVDLAYKQGIWVENDAYVPKVGDVVMYYWKDSGTGDCTGWPDHVGVVSAVSGNKFTVIEGNKANTVGTREMTVNGKYIRGFITPKYAEYAKSGSTTSAPVKEQAPNSGSANTTINTTGTINKTCKFVGVVTVKDDTLNVRSWAGTENPILREFKNGTEVEVCDTIKDTDGADWYYIKEGGKYGFVSAKFVVKKTASTTKVTFAKGDKVKVKAGAKWANGKGIASFVFSQTMYVIGSNASGIIISTSKNGAVTGVIAASNLVKA